MNQCSTRGYVYEGVVIVASILVAFALDASWGNYQEANLEQRILGDSKYVRTSLAAVHTSTVNFECHRFHDPNSPRPSERFAGAGRLGADAR